MIDNQAPEGNGVTDPPARVQIPVIVVATTPFTTVVFDERDRFDATLDQVNTNTYDRLKLCRTTMAVNGYIPEFTQKNIGVIVGYTGSFLYPRMRGVTKSTVISSVNTILLRLMFGGIVFNSVSPDDVGFGIVYGTGYYMAAGGASGKSYSLLNALQFQSASNFDTIQLMEPRSFTKAEFEIAITKGTLVVEQVPQINASMFLDGITHYLQYQLASALVFLWSTAETLIAKIWDDKVIPKGKGIVGRNDFVKSNIWQSAFKTEVLFQIGVISDNLYSKVNEARAARNKLAHRGESPTLEQCDHALEVTFSLVSLVVTAFERENEFASLIAGFKKRHAPLTGPLDPKFWREIPAVPGDDKWGDKPYPRHREIELMPVEQIKQRIVGKSREQQTPADDESGG
jgi:hypothetical protein